MLDELLRRASLTVETAATLLRRLSTNPWLYSVDCTVTFEPGQVAKTVPHGLGHTLNGAAVVGCSVSFAYVVVGLPFDAENVTVYLSTPSAYPATVKLRCY